MSGVDVPAAGLADRVAERKLKEQERQERLEEGEVSSSSFVGIDALNLSGMTSSSSEVQHVS